MPRRRYQAEEIIPKLREAEVLLSSGQKCFGSLSADWRDRQHVLSLAEGVRRGWHGSGEVFEGA